MLVDHQACDRSNLTGRHVFPFCSLEWNKFFFILEAD